MPSRLALLLTISAWTVFNPAVNAFPRPTTLPTDSQFERLNLEVGWKSQLPLASKDDAIASVQVIEQDVYVVMHSGRLLSLDLNSGREKWRFTFENKYLGTKPIAASRDTVFIVDGILIHALDRFTGKPIFREVLPSTPATGPVADVVNVYIPLSNQRIAIYNYRKLNVASPLPVPPLPDPLPKGVSLLPQSVETLQSSSQIAPSIGLLGSLRPPFEMARADSSFSIQTLQSLKPPYSLPKENEAPSIVPVKSLIGLADQTDILIRTNTPTKVLEQQINHRMVFPPLITSTSRLFTPTIDQIAISSSREFSLFYYEFDPLSLISGPLGQHQKMAYIPTSDSSLFALDTETNDQKWRFTAGGILDRKPVVTPDFVYAVGSRSGISKVKRESGAFVWENRQAVGLLALNNKYVYASDADLRLLVIDQVTGRTLTGLQLPDKVFTVANDENDRLILATKDGLLMSLFDRDIPVAVTVDPDRAISFAPPRPKVQPKKEEEPAEEMKKDEPKKDEPKKVEEKKIEEKKIEEPKAAEPKKAAPPKKDAAEEMKKD
jgi:hypothetical protein